ncbi:hypothetical protein NliqN6_4232 [Naganishia liquefaciens]|uniref:Cytoplasmic protein n=1 Tax=Naganishia liquefaciens TaxID=104408 RepID=A0A8H3TV57_9TREE|nr:hypothetical protein NliqN6_4232 [Naganishia liquefaciens]
MKVTPPIATSLPRILVSLFLTCPILIDYSYDSPNSGYVLAAPPVLTDEGHSAIPDLRVGLPAGMYQVEESLAKRHGDHDTVDGEDSAYDVMDMFDTDIMEGAAMPSATASASATSSSPTSHASSEVHNQDHVHGCHGCQEMTNGQDINAPVAPENAKPHQAGQGHGSPQHGHVHHSSSWVPLTEFNETDVINRHGVAPLSYLYHDFVMTPSETFDFRRTGLSAYGNATTDLTDLSQGQYITWQEEQYAKGAGSREQDRVLGGDGHPHAGLMALHVMSLSLAYFGVLPITLALRAAKLESLAYGLSKLVFGILVSLGWIAGVWYKAATPDLYAGHKHNISGNLLLLATLAIGALDLVAVASRLYQFAKITDKSYQTFLNIVVYCQGPKSEIMGEYERVAFAAQLELDDLEIRETSDRERRTSTVQDAHSANGNVIFTSPWANRADEERRYSQSSNTSDTSTLRDSPQLSSSPQEMGKHIKLPSRGMSEASSNLAFEARPTSDLRASDESLTHPGLNSRQKAERVGIYLLHFFTRGLVVWAYIVSIMGVVVYTGMGRSGYLPSLLAHLIKGSIFFWYGLLTFGRYLGAFAEYGWAWNARAPHKVNSRLPSAEMIESFVIFFYGITNTWMERIGSAPGDPYTIKQVQHISIAVMFWFGGLSGMGLESKTIRRLLATSATQRYNSQRKNRKPLPAPKSYSFSFNPFPALVIGILGIAMSAHKQDYVFQVTIHALWGYCLAGFSFFRLLTYFFLWVSPPSDSVMPSRPPTEGLASFCLACGGVLFFLSDEEIAYAAMRHSYDDGFAFLCWTVALVCFVFTWILSVMAVKGWAVERRAKRSAASDAEVASLTI